MARAHSRPVPPDILQAHIAGQTVAISLFSTYLRPARVEGVHHLIQHRHIERLAKVQESLAHRFHEQAEAG